MKQIRMKIEIEEIRVSNNGTVSQTKAWRQLRVPDKSASGYKPSRRACTELIYSLIRAGYTDEGRVALDAMRYPNGDVDKLISAFVEKNGE